MKSLARRLGLLLWSYSQNCCWVKPAAVYPKKRSNPLSFLTVLKMVGTLLTIGGSPTAGGTGITVPSAMFKLTESEAVPIPSVPGMGLAVAVRISALVFLLK